MSTPLLALREQIEHTEEKVLAPYACFAGKSKGRVHKEDPDVQRTCFARDRDRIIHCSAFRRLKGKTQVFVAHHGDHFRNRLTHTMEVAQLARDFSRNLRINEDLAEAIALAHDLGHTPFGHAGQQAMRELLHRFGYFFEHNQQSRRIVEVLEQRCPDYRGINLSWEVCDGLKKHRKADYEKAENLSVHGSLEAQIVDIADQIAYQNHDIDDGLRAGIFDVEDLHHLEIWKRASARVPRYESDKLWISSVISSLVKIMAFDLLQETEKRLQNLSPKTTEDVRNTKNPVAAFSREIEAENDSLRHFLYSRFYHQSEVTSQSEQGQQTIKQIFFFLLKNPHLIPKSLQFLLEQGEKTEIVIKDFIAGMTDDYAITFAKERINS
ncbi:deoxyguanosinetriphosphate triphosphohydrolase [Candidatus Peregrinibacteria bacterium]|nr:MAG: deoxyguanosinetriphosphate triphosphohydrolase [Candidatus Peregrinibacteria bacterium]